MDRYITKSKYFSAEFNTAIFADPIRIYFSNDQESQALELYFRMKERKELFDKFLQQRGSNNYCYIMLYGDPEEFDQRFSGSANAAYAPGEMGEDYICGLRGPMTSDRVDGFLASLDETLTSA